MAAQATYLDWIKRLPVSDAAYPACACPACGNIGLAYQYFGSGASDYGWKLVWCEKCKSAVHISRTKIPAAAHVLCDDLEQQEFIASHAGLRLIY